MHLIYVLGEVRSYYPVIDYLLLQQPMLACLGVSELVSLATSK